MKYCQKCGKELSDDAAFCSGCGNALFADEKKNCPQCGKKLSDDAAFCPGCGTVVVANEKKNYQKSGKDSSDALSFFWQFKNAISVDERKKSQQSGKELSDNAELGSNGKKKEISTLSCFFTVKRVLHILQTLFLSSVFSFLSDGLVYAYVQSDGWSNHSFFSVLTNEDEMLIVGIPFLILFGISFVFSFLLAFSDLNLTFASVGALFGTVIFYIGFLSTVSQEMGYGSGKNFSSATVYFKAYLILGLIIGAIILDVVAKAYGAHIANKESQE